MRHPLSKKRQAMEDRIVGAIQMLIQEQGLGKVSARDVAKRAGCSVGSIYSIFPDLDNAIFKANASVLVDMERALAFVDILQPPQEVLRGLARAYGQFALDNPAAWKGVFFHQPAPGCETPEWFLQLHMDLILKIVGPLRALRPEMKPEQSFLRARTLFAAVHGVVQLTMENRFVSVGPDSLLSEIDALVVSLLRGLD